MKKSNKTLMVIEAKEALEKELSQLLHVNRPEVIAEISAAREQGDLSENAEFDAARERQAHIEARIRELQKLIENAEIIKKSTSKVIVTVGSKIQIENLATKNNIDYEIIGAVGVDPFTNPKKISSSSPIGSALLGKKINDIIMIKSVRTPYKIMLKKIY